MPDDKYDTLGPAFGRIGEEIARRYDGDPNGLFFYVEIVEGMIDLSLFKDERENLRWVDLEMHDVSEAVFDAWYAEDADKRWASMEYMIRDGRFTASFKFPDEVDPLHFDESRRDESRRDEVLRARFGNKPVVYPPWPDGEGWELTPER